MRRQLLLVVLVCTASVLAGAVTRPSNADHRKQSVAHSSEHFQHLPAEEFDRLHQNRIVVKFYQEPSKDVIADVCARFHLEEIVERRHEPSVLMFHVAQGYHIRQVLLAMKGDPLFAWAHPLFARQQQRRTSTDMDNCHIGDRACIDDPIYNAQWHLRHDDNGLDVQEAWDHVPMSYGQGVLVAVVDDGLDTAHQDWDDRHVASVSYDYNDNDPDPTPFTYDAHGTAAAGVAVAGANSVCGLGAAPNAKLAGIRLIAKDTTDEQEAHGLGADHRLDPVDVYSASWGPTDDGRRIEGPGPLLTETFHDRTLHGRGGKGVIYVWAGGNGRSRGDNCNYDGYANSRFTFTIAARDHNRGQPYYSEDCAAMLASAPSSGSDTNYRISTTDLTGRNGDSATDCMASFGGTSAAAPLAAGVYALVLSINPELTWRDLLSITAQTARLSALPIDASRASAPYYTNLAGYKHMHGEGFGLLNVSGMCAMAATWPENSPIRDKDDKGVAFKQPEGAKEYECFIAYDSGNIALDIPDAGSPAAQPDRHRMVNLTLPSDEDFIVEAVEVYVWINHPHRGDVSIVLHHTNGMVPPTKYSQDDMPYVSILASPRSDMGANYIGWRFGSYRHWGESAIGVWSLIVADERTDGIGGSLTRWVLSLTGHRKDGSACK